MVNFIFASLCGTLTAYGFINNSYQFLIPLCFIVFIFFHTQGNVLSFFYYFSSLHIIGSLWLFVPIHIIGGLNYLMTLIVITVLGSTIGMIYSATLKCIYWFHRSQSDFSILYLIPTSIVLSEFIKLHILGGYPFLLFGYYFVNSSLKFIIPFMGIYGSSWLLILFCCLLTYILKKEKYHTLSIILLSLVLITSLNVKAPTFHKPHKLISLILMHTNKHYISTKYDNAYTNKKIINKNADLILYPEGMYTNINHIDIQHDHNYILTGLISYDNENDGFNNTMIGINNANKIDYIHKKHHLAQFNEWIPNGIHQLLNDLNLPSRGFIAGDGNDTNGQINQIKFMGLICYETLFTQFIYDHLKDANIIFSNSDLGWFEASSFEKQFYIIVKFMSLLVQKPIIMSSNIGPSAYIDQHGALNLFNQNTYIEVMTTNGKTPWMYYGDQTILFIILLISASIYYFEKKIMIEAKAKIN